MALDPNPNPATDPGPAAAPALDYVVPAYRAVSPLAVVSLVLGLFSVLCFASLNFLIAAVGAAVSGGLALRNIRRFPDMLTGQGIAQAGMALGLIFGMAAFSSSYLQYFLQKREATRFAEAILAMIREQPFENYVWYQAPPAEREKVTPQKALAEFRSSAPDPMMADGQLAPYKSLKDRLDLPGQQVSLERLLHVGPDGLGVSAYALYKISGPTSEQVKQDEEYALGRFKANVENGRYAWRLETIEYPFTPAES